MYSDSGEDNSEMTISLAGCDIQNARVNKRQLAIRLVKEGKELITLDVRNIYVFSVFQSSLCYLCQ